MLEGLGGSSEELGAFLFLRRGQASQKEVGPVCPWLVASDLGRATWPGLSAVPWAGAWTKPLALCPMPPILGASVSQLRRGGGLCAAAPSSGHVSLCFDHGPVPWEAPGGLPDTHSHSEQDKLHVLALGPDGAESEPQGVGRGDQVRPAGGQLDGQPAPLHLRGPGPGCVRVVSHVAPGSPRLGPWGPGPGPRAAGRGLGPWLYW